MFILFLYFIQNQGETITHLMHSRHQDHLTQTIKVKKKLPITKSAASNIFSTNPSGIFTGNSTQANTRLSNSFLDKLFIFTMFFFFFAHSQNSRLTVILSDPCNKFKGKDSCINTTLLKLNKKNKQNPSIQPG